MRRKYKAADNQDGMRKASGRGYGKGKERRSREGEQEGMRRAGGKEKEGRGVYIRGNEIRRVEGYQLEERRKDEQDGTRKVGGKVISWREGGRIEGRGTKGNEKSKRNR